MSSKKSSRRTRKAFSAEKGARGVNLKVAVDGQKLWEQAEKVAEQGRKAVQSAVEVVEQSEVGKKVVKVVGEGVKAAVRFIEDKLEETQQLLNLPRMAEEEAKEEEEEEAFFKPWLHQKKYVLGSEPIGLGGFSTVWPARLARKYPSFMVLESQYNLAIKICELDQANLDEARKEAEDEFGEAVSLSDGEMQQVSDIKELETEVKIITKLTRHAKQR